MSDLADFLLARIAEDEAVAKRAVEDGAEYLAYDNGSTGHDWLSESGEYDPARVLAECEAKRRIVGLHTGQHECVGEKYGDPQACIYVSPGFMHEDDPTLRLLALPYAGHPEYDERWRP